MRCTYLDYFFIYFENSKVQKKDISTRSFLIHIDNSSLITFVAALFRFITAFSIALPSVMTGLEAVRLAELTTTFHSARTIRQANASGIASFGFQFAVRQTT